MIDAAIMPKEAGPARLKSFLDKAERNLRRTVEGCRKESMSDAARHLKHYLDGTGERITYNRDRARSFNPVRNAEQARTKIRATILEKARDLEDGKSFTGQLRSADPGTHDTISHGLDMLRGIPVQPRLTLTSSVYRIIFSAHNAGCAVPNPCGIRVHPTPAASPNDSPRMPPDEDGDMKRVTENGKQRVTEQDRVRVLESGNKSESIAQIVADAVARLRERGREPKARVTVEETTVRAFDGTKVRVATEIIGTPAD